MWGRFWLRLIGRALLWSCGVLLLAYPCDFAVWKIRAARGGGMGSVTTFDLVAAEEKGNKEEYFPNGTSETPCSQSLFPQAAYTPCWYLSRHPDRIVRY